jgi:hypothetical protein
MTERERIDFKRLLKACEKLVAGGDPGRVRAYWPELDRLWGAYKRCAPHKREKLAAYERRVGLVAACAKGGGDTAKLAAATQLLSASTDDAVDREREAENVLEREAEEMAEMAAALKEANLRIRRTIREDSAVVGQIEDAVVGNLARLRVQSGLLGASVSARGFRAMLRLAALVVLAAVLFFFLYFFIRLFPRR